MRNKKNITALISLFAGILLLVCFFVKAADTQTVSASNALSAPLILLSDSYIYLPLAVLMILSGIVGVWSKSSLIRICTYAITVITGTAAVVAHYTSILPMYPCIIVSVSVLLVQIIDKTPNKRLFLIHKNGDMRFVFAPSKPTYDDYLASLDADLKVVSPGKKKIAKKPTRSLSNTTAGKVKKAKRKPHAGKLAKSPKGKNFKYKKKR